MEYLVTRLFRSGRLMPPHVRQSSTVRGLLSIRQEEDQARHRVTLVARMAGVREGEAPPPLYDAALVASTGDVWTITGTERVADGALEDERCCAQTWIIEPAPLEDLRRAEAEWGRLSLRVTELERIRSGSGQPCGSGNSKNVKC